MKIKTTTHLLLTLLLLAVNLLANESPRAELSYLVLCQMTQLDFRNTTGLTNQFVRFTAASENPNVSVADIIIFIDSTSGRIPLPLGTNGVFSLPITPSLVRENPKIIANQPKGSMLLKAEVTLSDGSTRNEKGLIRYSTLFVVEKIRTQAVSDLTELKKQYQVDGAMAGPIVIHLRAKTDADTAQVTILSKSGDIPVKPIESGHFQLSFDPNLMKEDPWIQMSTNCEWSIKTEMEGDAEPVGGTLHR